LDDYEDYNDIDENNNSESEYGDMNKIKDINDELSLKNVN
jgi:hypothetical protein